MVRSIKWACLVVFVVVIAYGGAYLWYDLRTRIRASMTVAELGDAGLAFGRFHEVHRHWPHGMQDVAGTRYGTPGRAISGRQYVNFITKAPFDCVADDNLFIRIGQDLTRVVIMLPGPYRTKLWPFGEMRTIVVAADSRVCYCAPSEIQAVPSELNRIGSGKWSW